MILSEFPKVRLWPCANVRDDLRRREAAQAGRPGMFEIVRISIKETRSEKIAGARRIDDLVHGKSIRLMLRVAVDHQ